MNLKATMNILKELYNFSIDYLNNNDIMDNEESKSLWNTEDGKINDLINNWWFVSKKVIKRMIMKLVLKIYLLLRKIHMNLKKGIIII